MNCNRSGRALLLAFGIVAASAAGGPAAADGIAVCTAPGDQLTPVAVPDGAGGCIIAWHDLRPTVAAGGVCFVQQVNPASVSQWTPNGVQLSTIGDFSNPAPAIATDAAGGAFVAYGGDNSTPRVQWVNAAGVPQWGADGVALTSQPFTRDAAIVRDINGAGGAIVVWRQDSGAGGIPDINAQKVDAAGVIQWGPNGAAVTSTNMNSETLPALISDGAGGAIIVFLGTNGCRVQRLNSAGVSQWPNTSLSSLSNNRRPAIVTDGSGGAVVAWAAGNTGIFVQRVTALGDRLWPPSNAGVQLCTAGNQCAMIPDGAGGAIVTWQDFRSNTNYNIYAQSVNGAGAAQWIGNGVEVCFAPDDQLAPMIVSDGGTGAILTWYDRRFLSSGDDIYVQRIDAGGTSQWTANGQELCTAPDSQRDPTVAADGFGGAFVAWQDHRSGTNDDIYVRHVDGNGQPVSVLETGPDPSPARVWPNPFLDRVRLAFVLPAAAAVRFEVFDVRGRVARAYEPRILAGGAHALTWDGRLNDGQPAGQGIYFLRVTGPGVAISRRVVRLE